MKYLFLQSLWFGELVSILVYVIIILILLQVIRWLYRRLK